VNYQKDRVKAKKESSQYTLPLGPPGRRASYPPPPSSPGRTAPADVVGGEVELAEVLGEGGEGGQEGVVHGRPVVPAPPHVQRREEPQSGVGVRRGGETAGTLDALPPTDGGGPRDGATSVPNGGFFAPFVVLAIPNSPTEIATRMMLFGRSDISGSLKCDGFR